MNVWATVFACAAVVLAAIGIWQDDLTIGVAAVVFAIFAHAES